MKFKFENLIIWQKAMDLGEDINKLSDKFPDKEIYNLSSQIRRAVDSIDLNISEGSIEQSKPELRDENIFLMKNLKNIIMTHLI